MLLDATNLVPTTDSVRTTAIGTGKPLSIRIMSMYPGRGDHRQLLVSSAVKSRATYDGAPRAMHYVFEDVDDTRLLHPSPDQSGSRVVYYSPAILDTALDIELRYSFDDFNLDQAKKWLEVASTAAELPVFAVATTLGGAGGAAAGKSVLYFAKQAVQLVLGAFDRWVDGENDWASNWTLSLEADHTGLLASDPGYVLFYGDGESGELLAPVDGDLDNQGWLPRSEVYRVDTRSGAVVYADRPNEIVKDEPYVLTYVNGAEEPELDGWKAAAVSAALAEKFLNVTGDTATDIGSLLEGYNDMYMARKYSEVGEQLKKKGLSDEQRAALKTKQDAYLKNIQDSDVQDIVAPSDSADDGQDGA